jgi:putative ABC transport system permease protein
MGDAVTPGVSVPSWTGVALSVVLVALTAGLAYHQHLGLTRPLLVASTRAGVQLVGVGVVLLVLFQHAGLWGALGWVVVMVAVGGQVAGRHGQGVPLARVAATVGIAAGTGLTLGALLVLSIVATAPRVVIPVGGMIVLGALQATGLALQRVRGDAQQARPQIEARLCLGLSARDAFVPYQRSALRTALLPAIDSTKVVGLISLPGAMTGLILAGVDPLTAIRYQIVVMYMLLAATALAALITARLAEHSLFDHAQRLVPLTGARTS